jgi:hypothetical protein
MRNYLLALLLVSGTALADSSALAVSGSTALSASGANSAATQGNTQAININSPGVVDYTGGYTVKNVPMINMGNVFPTSPCMGSSTVGASGVGFGISVGSSWTDHECGKRETARSFAAIGLNNDAIKILCSSEYAAAAPSCASVQPLPAQKPVTTATVSAATPDCHTDLYIAKRVGKPVCLQ